MPRAKTIIVIDADVLATITAAFEADRAALASSEAKAQAEAGERTEGWFQRWETYCGLKQDHERLLAVGIKYDLNRFAGRLLTPSERVRWQESIRRLEAAGKVVRYGNGIRPAPAPKDPPANTQAATEGNGNG